MTSADEVLRRIVREELARQGGAADPWLTVRAAADYASVSPRQVRRWISDGAVVTTGTGKLRRVRRSSVDAALASMGATTADDKADAALRRLSRKVA